MRDEPTRGRLSRELIVEAAVNIADERGLDAVTMREVGAYLRVEAMSLYRHVANKAELIGAAVECVWGEVTVIVADAAGHNWRGGIRTIVHSAHDTLLAHPWVLDVLGSTGGPPRFRMMDALLGWLTRAGLAEHDVYEGYHLLDALLIGYTLQERNYRTLPAAVMNRQLVSIPPQLTYLHEHIRQHELPHEVASTGLAAGLDLVLNTLARRIVSRS